jgi:anti-sigma B factor antagonist
MLHRFSEEWEEKRMEITEGKIKNSTILMLNGRLDASSSNSLKEKITSLSKEKQVRLIVDMGGVDFIDSSGLGSLVSCLRSVNKLGGDIIITSLQDHVRAVIELTRLHRIFQIFDDAQTAASQS